MTRGPGAGGLAAVALVAGLVALWLWATPLGETLSRPISDWQLRRLAPTQAPAEVLAVDIDDASLNLLEPELGAWPFKRDVYALIIDWLRDAGARAVALDLLLADSQPGDAALARAIARPGAPVVLAAAGLRSAGDTPLRRVPPPGTAGANDRPALIWPAMAFPAGSLWPAAEQPPAIGVITSPLDSDGHLRRMPLWHRTQGGVWPALPLAVWRALAPPGAQGPWPLDAEGQAHLAWPEAALLAPTLPFSRLARAALGTEPLDVAQVRGRVVFIGSSALLADNVMTVSGQSSGTAVLAFAYAALRDQRVLPPPNRWADGALVLLALAPALLAWRRGRADWRLDAPWVAGALVLMAALALALLYGAQQVTQWAPAAAWLLSGLGAALMHHRGVLQAQRRLAYERAVAAEANRAKSEFLANISHEIRTPLNALMGIAELLAESRLDATQRQHVQVFQESGQALQELINDLLDVSKIEAGRFELTHAPFSLLATLARLRSLLEPRAVSKGLAFEFEVAADVPDGVLGDRQRLEQALINLLGNAIKFTARGRVCLSVARTGAARQIGFTVTDSGIGIAPSQLEAIFDPYSQGDGSVTRRFGGTGLGLSITRSMARMMGGGVTVSSEPGMGSAFCLSAALPTTELPPAVAEATPAQAIDRPMRILLAEDNEVNVYVFRGMLARPGVHIEVAANGAAALALATAQVYDIAFFDWQMPGMDGLTLARELRALEAAQQRSRLPLVALTANAFAADVQRSLEAGYDMHLTKPAGKSDLLGALAQLLPVRPAHEGAPLLAPVEASPRAGLAAASPVGISPPDRERALKQMGGEESLYQRVAEHAAVFLLHWSREFDEAERDRKHDRALRLAHDLKSVSNAVGAIAMAQAATLLEASLRGSDIGAADRTALSAVRQNLPPVIAALTPSAPG